MKPLLSIGDGPLLIHQSQIRRHIRRVEEFFSDLLSMERMMQDTWHWQMNNPDGYL
jgi:hypothetical protein